MISAAAMRALVAAGATSEMLIAAVEAEEKIATANVEAEREANRLRQQRHRSRVSRPSRDVTPVTPVTRDNDDKQNQQLGAEQIQTDHLFLEVREESLQGSKDRKSSKRLGVAGSPSSPPSLFFFDQFWEACPHKVGKGAAERAFDRVRKSGRVTFAELMAGLERYKASKPVDRPWCNPATWLNERRWEDRPADNGSAPSLSLVMPEHGNQHAGRVYLRRETPQFEAWAAHTGKAVTDKHGGWWFDSEWPPEKRMASL